MFGKQKKEPVKPRKRILVSDPIGDLGKFLKERADDLEAEVRICGSMTELSLEVAMAGGDLAVLACHDSLDALERFRDDPRTRYIPLIVATAQNRDPEAHYHALAAADQLIDYPFDEDQLPFWIDRGLRRAFDQNVGGEYAQAPVKMTAEANWLGRVVAVSGNRLWFETNIFLPVGGEYRLTGPLVAPCDDREVRVRVVSFTSERMYYFNAVRLELEILCDGHDATLADHVRGEVATEAKSKVKIGVIAENALQVSDVAGALDTGMYAVRWLSTLQGIGSTLAHLDPALLLVDPMHPELLSPGKVAGLGKIQPAGLKILPIRPPENPEPWERLQDRCPVVDVPCLGSKAAWNELAAAHAMEPAAIDDPDRFVIPRTDRHSHARITTPAELVRLSEFSGEIVTEMDVDKGARLCLVIADLVAEGHEPMFGRVMQATKAGKPSKLVWMGVGGTGQASMIRKYVTDVIMEARRKERRSDPDQIAG